MRPFNRKGKELPPLPFTRNSASATGDRPAAAPSDPRRLLEAGGQLRGQGAEEATAGPWPPLPLHRYRSWASGAPTLHLSACRPGGRGGWSDGLATTGQWPGRASARQASLRGRKWVSMAVCSWQAIRHAMRMGGSSPMAGEEWREGGLWPPHGRTKYKLSSAKYKLSL